MSPAENPQEKLTIDQIAVGDTLICIEPFDLLGDFEETDFDVGETVEVISVQDGEIEIINSDQECDHVREEDIGYFRIA